MFRGDVTGASMKEHPLQFELSSPLDFCCQVLPFRHITVASHQYSPWAFVVFNAKLSVRQRWLVSLTAVRFRPARR
jgi:hypothetical protein